MNILDVLLMLNNIINTEQIKYDESAPTKGALFL